MNVYAILQELKAERDHLDQAIEALTRVSSARGRADRPKATVQAPRKRARRRMSAAARAKLARLMKQRWAARKKAGKSTLGG